MPFTRKHAPPDLIFEALQRDLERISRALGSGRLPTTVEVKGRKFVVSYTSIREARGEPGIHIAEVELAEAGKGILGGVSLEMDPKAETARIAMASAVPRRVGLGQAMVEAVERDLKARGYYLVDLLARPDSIPFWKALGYVPQAAEVPGEGLEMAKRL